ncbi:MAG: BREX-1 system phosphatase PglZ type B, partial [Syntrophales bacterium LBB04]|nr:BREX-1 system phosphatase PglZ type B [Syntrophales bacterium LBB04]
HEWSALPTVTATAKHAWMPLAEKLGGPLDGEGFEPKEQSSGKTLTYARFQQLVQELGIPFLSSDLTLFPTGCAWTEFGSIDTSGHNQGSKLAWRVEEELDGLQRRILELIHVGWTKIKVITDHGWLLLPGGLPKAELPKHLTASRWNRCAIPSAGAQHGYPMTPWFWDAAEAVVLAPGVSCFVAGMEYAHGGLTLQEALIPSLTISNKQTGGLKSIVLREMKWSGLKLNVVLDGAQGLTIDVRGKVADAATSFAASPITCAAADKKTSLLVADDEALGDFKWGRATINS